MPKNKPKDAVEDVTILDSLLMVRTAHHQYSLRVPQVKVVSVVHAEEEDDECLPIREVLVRLRLSADTEVERHPAFVPYRVK